MEAIRLTECRRCGAKHEDATRHICAPYGLRVKRLEAERQRLDGRVRELERVLAETKVNDLHAEIGRLRAELEVTRFEEIAAKARNAELRADMGRCREREIETAKRLDRALGALLGLASCATEMHEQLNEVLVSEERTHEE